ncbi:hypothetical protein MTO96_042157 [Rhipicephalus appendiculatus]
MGAVLRESPGQPVAMKLVEELDYYTQALSREFHCCTQALGELGSVAGFGILVAVHWGCQGDANAAQHADGQNLDAGDIIVLCRACASLQHWAILQATWSLGPEGES